MKKAFLAIIILYFFGQHSLAAQAKIWRSIDLTKYPNTYLTAQDVGFRQVLIQGIQRGKVKVYANRDQFASFQKRIRRKQANKVLAYYDDNLKEMVALRPDDFSILEIQEFYDATASGTQKYQIQAIVLKAPSFSKSFVIKYKHFKRHLNKMYKRSRRKKDLMVLKAYWQSPENNTMQVAVPTALEQRKFSSKILKTEGLDKPTETALKNSKGYSPKPKKPKEIFQAPWLKLDEQTVRATTRYLVDLKATANAPLYKKGNGIVKIILEGIKRGKIKPYVYTPTPQKYMKRLKKKRFLSKLSYYEESTEDTVEVQAIDLHKLELVGYWEVNTQAQKAKFTIERINFLIPKGTNTQTQFGNLRVAQLKYRKVISYLEKAYRKAQREGTGEATWVNPKNVQEKMSLAQALATGYYHKQLNWFANQQDLGIFSLQDNLEQIDDASFLTFKKAQKHAEQYLENYGKK